MCFFLAVLNLILRRIQTLGVIIQVINDIIASPTYIGALATYIVLFTIVLLWDQN